MIWTTWPVEFSHYQIAQRHCSEQSIRLRVHDVARVNRLFLTRDGTNVLQRVGDSHLRIEPHKLRRHNAAGSVVGILKQVFQFGAHVRRELGQDAMPLVKSHLLDYVGAFVGGKTFENCGDA